ncbi:MAG: type II toxin-antitoxin system VapC family toxin [Bdellovibrionota bacterium]
MVVDTSVILASFFNQEHFFWAASKLQEYKTELRMCTVNLCETHILIRDKQPQLFEDLKKRLETSPIRFVPPSVEQSELAAKARMQFPLNLGDCFAYSLAKSENCPILTLDKDFKKTDLEVIIP